MLDFQLWGNRNFAYHIYYLNFDNNIESYKMYFKKLVILKYPNSPHYRTRLATKTMKKKKNFLKHPNNIYIDIHIYKTNLSNTLLNTLILNWTATLLRQRHETMKKWNICYTFKSKLFIKENIELKGKWNKNQYHQSLISKIFVEFLVTHILYKEKI